jgi:hypothetical protein
MTAACQWMYAPANQFRVIDRYSDFYEASSVNCYTY